MPMTPTRVNPRPLRELRRFRTVLITTGIGIETAVAVLVAIVMSHSHDQWRAGGLIPVIGAVSAVAAPVVLACWGWRRGSTAAVIAAAFACMPEALLSVVCLPALLACFLLLASPIGDDRLDGIYAVLLAVVAQIAVLAILVFGRSSYLFQSGQSSDSGSYINPSHGAAAIAVSVAGVGLAILLAKRRGRGRIEDSVASAVHPN